jgi:hypothetical protein
VVAKPAALFDRVVHHLHDDDDHTSGEELRAKTSEPARMASEPSVHV